MTEFRQYKLFYAYIKSKQYDLAQQIAESNQYFDLVAFSMPKHITFTNSTVLEHKPYNRIKPLNQQVSQMDEILWFIYNDDHTLFDIIRYKIHYKSLILFAGENYTRKVLDKIDKLDEFDIAKDYHCKNPHGEFAQITYDYHKSIIDC